MSYEKPRILSVSGRTITIDHLELPRQPKSVITVDAAAGATSFTVLDNTGFVQNYPVLIGVLGAAKSEIKKVNAAVTAGTALTFTASTFSHAAGTPVQRILFNQFKIYGTTTNVYSTSNLVATVDMAVDAPYTTYVNTGTEYTYYWVTPFDSLNTVTGDANSDSILASTGYSENTVGAVIASALKRTKQKKDTELTMDFLLEEINACLRFASGKLKHWSNLESFNTSIGVTTRGTYRYAMPTDIEEANSIRSILNTRIGARTPLIVKDKREMLSLMQNAVHTTIRTQAVAADTSLNIVNSYDLPDSGSVHVYVSGTKYTVTYTGVTRSTTAGVLTGVPASGTGSITVTMAADLNVWYQETEGIPAYVTAYDGYVEIWPLPDATYDNQNVFLDYFTTKTIVDSDGDTLSGFRFDMVKHWLIWKIRGLKSGSTGKLDMKDTDFVMFEQILKDQTRTETTGQRFKFIPRVNSIDYGRRYQARNLTNN